MVLSLFAITAIGLAGREAVASDDVNWPAKAAMAVVAISCVFTMTRLERHYAPIGRFISSAEASLEEVQQALCSDTHSCVDLRSRLSRCVGCRQAVVLVHRPDGWTHRRHVATSPRRYGALR